MTEPTATDETSTTALSQEREAIEQVLAEAQRRDDPLNLGVLTDEELFAYCSTAEEAAPQGLFFSQLSEEQQQAASLGALRALLSRGEIEGGELDAEQSGELELPTQLVAALALRRMEAQLSLQVIGSVGSTWYILRHVRGGLFLREVMTTHGFHLLSLVRLDESERETFVDGLALPEGAEEAVAPDVDVVATQAQIEGAEIGTTSAFDFLSRTVLVGNLVRVPGVEGVVTSMVNVLPEGAVVIGDVEAGRVRYRGATVATLRDEWDVWAAEVASALAEAGGATPAADGPART